MLRWVRRVVVTSVLLLVWLFVAMLWLLSLDAYGPARLEPLEFCHTMHERAVYDRGVVERAARSKRPPQTTCDMAGFPPRSWPRGSAWEALAWLVASLTVLVGAPLGVLVERGRRAAPAGARLRNASAG